MHLFIWLDRLAQKYFQGFHLRSISTWLKGVCRSFCVQHSWDPVMARLAARTGKASTPETEDAAPTGWEVHRAGGSQRPIGGLDSAPVSANGPVTPTFRPGPEVVEIRTKPLGLSTTAEVVPDGYIGGLKSEIEDLRTRAAVLSHDAKRRTKALRPPISAFAD